jgi:hypothetical protein
MKRILQLLWCWLALGLLLTFQFFLSKITRIPLPFNPVTALIPGVLSAAVVFLFARKNVSKWSRFFGVLYVGLFVAFAAGLLVYSVIVAFFGFPRCSFILASLPAAIIGVVLGILISQRSLWKGFASGVIVLVIASGLIFTLAQMQKSVIRKYEREWKAKGISMELTDLFPMPYSKPQCQAWFDVIASLTPENKKSPWRAFCDDAVVPFSREISVKALEKGEDLRVTILALPSVKDPLWAEYPPLESEISSAMEKCPHVQWFRPEEYKDRFWDAPTPKFLALMRWSRAQLAKSQTEAAWGKVKEASESLILIHKGARKFLVKGQHLANVLTGISMEKLWLIGEAGMMGMSGEPLAPAERQFVDSIAMDDLSWFLGSWKVETLVMVNELKNPGKAPYIGDFINRPHHCVSLWGMVLRASVRNRTANSLENSTNLILLLQKDGDISTEKFKWHQFHDIKWKEPEFYSSFLRSAYGRVLAMIAQARLVLMMDEVMRYRKDHKDLPENLDFVQAPWRTDPFTEEPLIYKKEGEKIFVVYSPGPDMRDDGAKNLYVGGVMTFKDETKEDIGFRIGLQ